MDFLTPTYLPTNCIPEQFNFGQEKSRQVIVNRTYARATKKRCFSIAWTRIIPDGRGTVNEEGIDLCKRLVDCLHVTLL